MTYIKRDNVSIHYRKIASENPSATDTLILIHGLGPDMRSWEFAMPYILQNYHVLMYDLRGHGKSDAGEETRNLSMLTEDLRFLIQELAINNYHIIAQGFSGFIGVQYATEDHDGNMKTLTLMTSPVYYPKQLGNEIIGERRKWVQEEGSLYSLAKMIITQNCYPLTEEKASILFQAYDKVSPTLYFELFRNHFEGNAAQQLGSIKVPTLLLSGGEDDIYPPELFGASLHLYQNARHYIIPNASFMMQMDQPKLTVEWIHQFIENSTAPHENTQNTYRKKLTTQLYTEMHELTAKDSTFKLNVDILNGFAVYLNGKRIHGLWGKRKAKQLLVYLAYQQSATRDELCDTFWPDVDLKSAKNSLRVSLHHLKKTLELNGKSPVLTSDKEHVFLLGNVQSDLRNYTEKIGLAHQQVNDDARAATYKLLLGKVSDNPLPGLYEDWFINLRNQLEKELGTMALYLAEYYEKRKNHRECSYYMKLALHYYHYDVHLQNRLEKLEQSF
ncbi:alpha/beta hydrolase [Virgibacillus doumboii]|uniref:alpha/beta hydrolase n=1 Tax=Virgibacillus doumboii TaxID=2697503 RepID=UPI0013DF75F4|nr:alpha/beta hydrolase [Virgibacillus doumboii]